MFQKVDLQNPNVVRWAFALIIISLPFYFNDFYYLANRHKNPLGIYLLDYACRFWYLGFAYFFFREQAFRLESSLKPIEKRDILIDYILWPLILYVVYRYGYYLIFFFRRILGVSEYFYFRFPSTLNMAHKIFDLTIGVALVAVTEELIFRRYYYSFFAYITKRSWLGVLFQAFFFAIGHWATGTTNVVGCFVFGLFTGAFYHYKKDLKPLICAHFAVDFITFLFK